MQSVKVFLLLLASCVACWAATEEKQQSEFHLDKKAKEQLLSKDKFGVRDVFFLKNLEFWMKNPIKAEQRECFAKLKPGESIDFVIDLAPSPSKDEVDKLCALSPLGYYFTLWSGAHLTASKAYFKAIEVFIDGVTIDIKPELCHAIVYDKNNVEQSRKFYLRGRAIETIEMKHHFGEFIDLKRNLKTMWPVPTGSKPEETPFRPILKNNLGRLTKLALWNRDNGLATVLNGSERSKAVYTIVITDGQSGARLEELTRDLSRTTLIDVGNHRFTSRLSVEHMKELAHVVNVPAPQVLAMLINTVRTTACWLINE